MNVATTVKRTYPVIETFGPTIQGEGPDAGKVCYFVRLGGCDYRCVWCDTMYAVDPAEVRANSVHLETQEILDHLCAPPGSLIVLSGGNPALHNLSELVDTLHEMGHTVSVETQGSVWREWLQSVDLLVVSPKPPSAETGMSPRHLEQRDSFMTRAVEHPNVVVKIVVFDQRDLDWARDTHRRWSGLAGGVPLYLSAGTPQDVGDDGVTVEQVLIRYRWLCEAVTGDEELKHARVLPQLHVLAFGTVRGV